MKKISKKIIAAFLLAATVMSLCGCGEKFDMSKVQGDWTLYTVNGKSVAEYAKSKGVNTEACNINVNISATTYKATNYSGSQENKIRIKEDGFDVIDNNKEVIISVRYSDDTDTLNYKVDDPTGNTKNDCVFKRGTSELAAPIMVEK